LASGTAMPDSLWWVTRSIRRVEFPMPTALMMSGPRRLAAPDLRELTPGLLPLNRPFFAARQEREQDTQGI
jgi:hypothetical protein